MELRRWKMNFAGQMGAGRGGRFIKLAGSTGEELSRREKMQGSHAFCDEPADQCNCLGTVG